MYTEQIYYKYLYLYRNHYFNYYYLLVRKCTTYGAQVVDSDSSL